MLLEVTGRPLDRRDLLPSSGAPTNFQSFPNCQSLSRLEGFQSPGRRGLLASWKFGRWVEAC